MTASPPTTPAFGVVRPGTALVWGEPTLLVTAAPDGGLVHDGVAPGAVDVAVGGSAFATAYALAACGWPTRLWAPVPDDDVQVASAAARACLELSTVPSADLRSTVSVVSPDGSRSMVSGPSTVFDAPSADQVPDPAGAVLHVSLSSLARDRTGAVRRLLGRARCPVSIDLGSPSAVTAVDLDELVAEVRPAVVLANADEHAATGWDGCPDGVGVYVVKHGGGAAVVRTADGEAARRAPVKVPVVDTTGAGDAFAAGFLHGWLSGASAEASLGRAHQVASAVVGHLGPVVRLPVAVTRH